MEDASALWRRYERWRRRDVERKMAAEERAAAAQLVAAGLFEARDMDAVFRAFDRARRRSRARRVREARTCCWCLKRKKMTAEERATTRIQEFYAYYRLEPSAFTTQVLLLPKKDFRGDEPLKTDLAFAEFAVSLWLLCSFDLATLAFSIVDTEGWGRASREEIRGLVAQVYAPPVKALARRVDGALGGTAKNGTDDKIAKLFGRKDEVTLAEFADVARKHHNLLLPAFRVQRAVREKTFGHLTNWDAVEVRRRKTVRGRTVRQVIADLGMAAFQDAVPPAQDTYKYELDASKVLDQAAEAYKRGDYDRARQIHAHFTDFDTKNPKALELQRREDEAKRRFLEEEAADQARKKKKWGPFAFRTTKKTRPPSVVRNPALALIGVGGGGGGSSSSSH